jgi:hypothetical protein
MTMRRHSYTLVELLTAMAVASAIAGAAIVLLNRTFSYRSAVQERIDFQGEVRLLAKAWRAWVEPTKPGTWRTDGNAFRAGQHTAAIQGGKLVLPADGKTKRLPLPPDVTATFALERAQTAPEAAILRLDWTVKRGDRTEARSVRIVACAHPEPSQNKAE